MKNEGKLSKFIVFCHRNSIAAQWIDSSNKIDIKLVDFSSFENNTQSLQSIDGFVITYQSATKKIHLIESLLLNWSQEKILAIADEAHHLGISPDGEANPSWGNAFVSSTTSCSLKLGLTGTPFRSDNLIFCSAKSTIIKTEKNLFYEINPDLSVQSHELINSGDIRPLEFRFLDGLVEHIDSAQIPQFSKVSSESRDTWRARNLRQIVKLSDPSTIAINLLIRAQKQLDRVRSKDERAAGLVIAKDIDHAVSIAKFLREDGSRVDLVHSQDRDSCSRLSSFEQSQSDWLVSVDMCSEGFDAPRIRVIAYMSTVVTKSRFLQAITRAVRVNSHIASLEPIPRFPSYVFAPADPLLIDFAKGWSITPPYLIRRNYEDICPVSDRQICFKGPQLPLKAIGNTIGELISIRSAQLPSFLK